MRLDLLVQRSVALLQLHTPPQGAYQVGYSGGKDSLAVEELCKMAEVPFELNYNVTTIDPPELVKFVKAKGESVRWRFAHGKDGNPLGHLLTRALSEGFPSSFARWCCKQYKESHTSPGATDVLGIRIAESRRRAATWTACAMPSLGIAGAKIVLPIRLWSDANVWEFIRWRKLTYCSLYDEGFKRLGCVGCPMITRRQRDAQFERWPAIGRQWSNMFERLWAKRAQAPDRRGNVWWGLRNFDTWQELFAWWNDGQGNVSAWRREHRLRAKCVAPPKPAGPQGELFLKKLGVGL